MESTGETLLPFRCEEHPRAPLIRDVIHAGSEFRRLTIEHGPLLTQAQVATVLGVTKQSVSSYVTRGAFSRINLRMPDGEVLGSYVPLRDVVAWLKANPKGGRGKTTRAAVAEFTISAADISWQS